MRILFFLLLISANAQAATLPHLDLEMTGPEYERALARQALPLALTLRSSPLDAPMALGKRNLDWLRFINDHRSPGERLSFSSKETQTGTPIDKVSESNEQIVMERYRTLLSELPQEMRAVLVDGKPFVADVGLSDKDYLLWGLKVDRVYQQAARWIMQIPYRQGYIQRKHTDIRGYYFLNKEENLREKLAHWTDLDSESQAKLRGWLQGMCFNEWGASERGCASELAKHVTKNTVQEYYEKYLPVGKETYDSFFSLSNPRSDVNWNASNENVMQIPFRDPKSLEVLEFLRTNIEDEWRFAGWQLQLDFRGSYGNPYIVFEPGATPHVNALGGDEITMDANQPLTEYNVQWTIRHEFGHVLGLPDCYIEFYDQERGVMVNYQIDVTNLMCSRKGHIQQTHVDELKKHYFR